MTGAPPPADVTAMPAMPGGRIHIACLCAAWCDLCEAYAVVFDEVRTTLLAPQHELRWHWIDIENDSTLLGELDIETFPTIVIADARQIRFAGPLIPQADTLRRLLRATLLEAGDTARWPAAAPQAEAFAHRLRRIG